MAASIFPLAGNTASAGASGNIVSIGASGASLGAGIAALPSVGLLPVAAVPIVGGIIAGVAAIAGIFMQASAKRAQEARGENAAVTSAVQHVDEALAQIFQAANSGQIDAPGAIMLLEQVQQQYWQIVTPQIQPGRNACQGGAAIPDQTTHVVAGVASCTADATNAYYGCPHNPGSGHGMGAACCVGATIQKSIANCAAVFQAGGGTAQICNLSSSKYGFPGRAQYSLTYKAPALASVTGAVADIAAPLQKVADSLGLPSSVAGVSSGMLLLVIAGFFLLRRIF